MGQKVNPHGLRVGIIRGWNSQWYASKKDFSDNLIEDYNIRTFIKKKYYAYSISRITITRIQTSAGIIKINIYSARPGMVIGQEGAGVEQIKNEIRKIAKNKVININVLEVQKPDTNAQLVAEKIAKSLEDRVSFRRAMKSAMNTSMKFGIKGIKTTVSGRLDGAEIARSEEYHEGSIPLQTLRADIDYGFAEAHTTFGILGVKVLIYNGEILHKNISNLEGGNA